MINFFSKYFSLFVSLTALTVVGSAFSARSETTNSTTPLYSPYISSSQSAPTTTPYYPAPQSVSNTSSAIDDTKVIPTPEELKQADAPPQPQNTTESQIPKSVAQSQPTSKPKAMPKVQTSTPLADKFINNQSAIATKTAIPKAQNPVPAANEISTILPAPGTAATSADGLTTPTNSPEPQGKTKTQNSKVAQVDITPGRTNRSGSSYIGVGGNIGISGNDTSLSRGNFAIISKIGLTNNFSVRPAAIFGSDTTILLPITYDFALGQRDPFETFTFAPYVGAGATYSTENSKFGFLLSGGIDVPLSREFTATAGVNVSFKNRTDVGLLLGIGYNFVGF